MQKTELFATGTIIVLLGIISGTLVLHARSQLRDVTRIAHMREVQIGLDLYFMEHGKYPQAGSEGNAIALGQVDAACLDGEGFVAPCANDAEPFIAFVPQPPVQGLRELSSCDGEKNAYCYTSNEETFRVQFEIESANAQVGLEKGLNCLSETGFASGACPAYSQE